MSFSSVCLNPSVLSSSQSQALQRIGLAVDNMERTERTAMYPSTPESKPIPPSTPEGKHAPQSTSPPAEDHPLRILHLEHMLRFHKVLSRERLTSGDFSLPQLRKLGMAPHEIDRLLVWVQQQLLESKSPSPLLRLRMGRVSSPLASAKRQPGLKSSHKLAVAPSSVGSSSPTASSVPVAGAKQKGSAQRRVGSAANPMGRLSTLKQTPPAVYKTAKCTEGKRSSRGVSTARTVVSATVQKDPDSSAASPVAKSKHAEAAETGKEKVSEDVAETGQETARPPIEMVQPSCSVHVESETGHATPRSPDAVCPSHRLQAELEKERRRREEAEAARLSAEKQLAEQQQARMEEVHTLQSHVELLQESLAAAREDAETNECVQLLETREALREERMRLEHELQQVADADRSGDDPQLNEDEEELQDKLRQTILELHITEDELEQRRSSLQALISSASSSYIDLETAKFECVE